MAQAACRQLLGFGQVSGRRCMGRSAGVPASSLAVVLTCSRHVGSQPGLLPPGLEARTLVNWGLEVWLRAGDVSGGRASGLQDFTAAVP